MGHELYIYWRTPAAGWHDAALALAAWQQQVCAGTPGLQARWLRRADDDAASVTLMEIWQQPGGVGATTAQRIVDEGNTTLAGWLAGSRHVEIFEPG